VQEKKSIPLEALEALVCNRLTKKKKGKPVVDERKGEVGTNESYYEGGQ
jgi:hypothetical protein